MKKNEIDNQVKLIRRKSLKKEIVNNRAYYLMLIPCILFFVLIKYRPLWFLQVAFKDYRITIPVDRAKWVGLKYFSQLFTSADFLLALKNTLIIAFYRIVFGFPAPIILALLLNELKLVKFKKVTQTLVYLPHFISWVVIGGILRSFLTTQGGVVNLIVELFGQEPIGFLTSAEYFRGILVVSGIWKEVGWGTILYLAAMTGINSSLYESARIDGANRFQQILHITLPGITYVIVTLLIIQIGSILTTGYEQIFVLYNPIMKSKGLILPYYVYEQGLSKYRYSFAAAAGLFNSIIAFIFVYSSDRISKKLGQRGIF